MSAAEVALVVAGVAGAGYLLRRRAPGPRRASWDVPPVQRWHADRLGEAAGLYRAGRDTDARILLRDRALDWNLICAAAGAQLLDPVARRLARTLERDGVGMFLNELHRLSAAERNLALDTLVRALAEYTGPTDEGSR